MNEHRDRGCLHTVDAPELCDAWGTPWMWHGCALPKNHDIGRRGAPGTIHRCRCGHEWR